MKLSKLYSNQEREFPPLVFADGLNVILAKVAAPTDLTKDSHNLGKTLLIHLIDFLLLKNLEKGHFLYDNKKLFKSFVFYLEIQVTDDSLITIRREVSKASKVSLITHREHHQDYTALATEEWPQSMLPLQKARTALNTALDLTGVQPWDYRKGSGYFLRTQYDYRDVFQLARFSVGRHKEWKPFMAHLLGFDHEPIQQKYDLDDQVDELSKEIISQGDVRTPDYDRVKGTLAVKKAELKDDERSIGRFNFYEEDLRTNAELVDRVETEISSLNEELYTISYEVEEIRRSLQRRSSFDFEEIQRLFREAGVAFGSAVTKSYEELLAFNEELTADRFKRLSERQTQLKQDAESVAGQLASLNADRERLLGSLIDKETFQKFRQLHRVLVEREKEIVRLESELKDLDKIGELKRQRQKVIKQRDDLVIAIQEQINKGNATYEVIRSEFNRIVKEITNHSAVISIIVNASGNLEFSANILSSDGSGHATSEDKGTSYRQLLCCAFDMALLVAHGAQGFYRFVYHDGVLEGLDDRKKIKLLSVVRDLCSTKKLQYILTAIESDLPRRSDGTQVNFGEGEILRELYEGSNQGRLFRMPLF